MPPRSGTSIPSIGPPPPAASRAGTSRATSGPPTSARSPHTERHVPTHRRTPDGLVRRSRKSHTGPRKPPTFWGRLMYGRSARVPDLVPALTRGKHRNPRKGACFMELASYLAGERWSDHPRRPHPLLRYLARLVNDPTSDA